MHLRILAIALSAALLAGACGDDDSLDLASLADESGEDPGDPSAPAEEPESEPDADVTDTDSSPSDDEEGPSTTEPKEPVDAEAKQGEETLAAFFEGDISSETEQCMIEGLLGDPALLDAILAIGAGGALSELAEPDQIAAIDLGLSCVTPDELSTWIQAGLGDSEDEPFAAAAGACLSEQLADESNSDRTTLMLGLVAASESRPPSPEQIDLIVALLIECVDSAFLVESSLQSVVDDPALEAAVDPSCLDTAFNDQTYLDQFYRLLLENPDVEFEQLAPEQQLQIVEPMFGCISFGTVIAASVAESGVELSAEAISCLDAAIDAETLSQTFLFGDELDESELVATLLPCLSPEELGALG